MKRYNSTGLSLPNELIRKIDSERGDVSRSRFLLRLIERVYLLQEKEKENGGSVRS
jgi:metal-responsive CopG/Arc/MetJ family transcriptional regulator